MVIFLAVLLNSVMVSPIFNLNSNTGKLHYWKKEILNIERVLKLD